MPRNFEQPTLPGLSNREILEAQKPEVLKQWRAEMLEQLSDIESAIHLVNDVLGGMGADDDEVEHTEYDHETNIVRGEN